MLRRFSCSIAIMAAFLATGCAHVTNDDDYPSLERRAVEVRLAVPADSSPPATPPLVTADLVTAIAALEADAARGDTAFRSALASVEPQVSAARAAAVASDAWFTAQAALSGLDQTRSGTMLALAELDRLHVAAEMDGRRADADMLADAATRVAALAAGQRTAMDQLFGLLAQ